MTEILRAGVMGWPVKHSKSPRMHGYWLNKYNISGSYTHIETAPDDFHADLKSRAAAGWRGMNVTIPHKEAALAAADIATERATAIGAANTLIIGEDGAITADNTDAFGFSENLIHGAGVNLDPTKPALVLGAGGAARAVVYALLNLKFTEIRLTNRTRSRAEALANLFGPAVKIIDWEQAEHAVEGASLIVNTTSLGMKGQPPLTIRLDHAAPGAVATDIVYTPLETSFLQRSSAAGLHTVDGLGMLLHQARPGFQAWFGVMPEVDEPLRTLMLAP